MIKAEHVPYDSMGTMYMFPDEDDDLTNYTGRITQVMIPNGLLQSIGKYNAIHNCMENYTICEATSKLPQISLLSCS